MKVTRKSKGQSLAELGAGMMVFVPVILLLIDCAVIMLGVSANEAACRDAARAASSGPPAALSASAMHTVGPGSMPYKRALSVVKDIYAPAGMVKIKDQLTVKEGLKNPLPLAPEGGPVIGQVSVETTVEVYPPFLIRVFAENGTYTFKNTQSYPYTYVMPSS